MEENKKEEYLIDGYRKLMNDYLFDCSRYVHQYYSEIDNRILFARKMQQTFSELDIIMTDNNIECDEMKKIIKQSIKSCTNEIRRDI